MSDGEDMAKEMWDHAMAGLDKALDAMGVGNEVQAVAKHTTRALVLANSYLHSMGFDSAQTVLITDFNGWINMVESNKRATNRTLAMCQKGAEMAMNGLGMYPEDGRNN